MSSGIWQKAPSSIFTCASSPSMTYHIPLLTGKQAGTHYSKPRFCTNCVMSITETQLLVIFMTLVCFSRHHIILQASTPASLLAGLSMAMSLAVPCPDPWTHDSLAHLERPDIFSNRGPIHHQRRLVAICCACVALASAVPGRCVHACD